MKYTMQVWIDFDAESRADALEITDDLRDRVKRAVRGTAATTIDFEWTPDERALRTLAPPPFAEKPLQS